MADPKDSPLPGKNSVTGGASASPARSKPPSQELPTFYDSSLQVTIPPPKEEALPTVIGAPAPPAALNAPDFSDTTNVDPAREAAPIVVDHALTDVSAVPSGVLATARAKTEPAAPLPTIAGFVPATKEAKTDKADLAAPMAETKPSAAVQRELPTLADPPRKEGLGSVPPQPSSAAAAPPKPAPVPPAPRDPASAIDTMSLPSPPAPSAPIHRAGEALETVFLPSPPKPEPSKQKWQTVTFAVFGLMALIAIVYGVSNRGARPRIDELRRAYPFGYRGAEGPRGEHAPGAASVTYKFLMVAPCPQTAEPQCLLYEYSSGNFVGRMLLRKGERGWERVSDEGMPFLYIK